MKEAECRRALNVAARGRAPLRLARPEGGWSSMRIAVPIWEDRVSPVLDTASTMLIVEVEDQKEASRFETFLDEQELHRRCMRIQGLGVNVLICGAVSRPFLRMLSASGMDIIHGISGNPEDVLEAYLKGILYHERFLMPGFKKNRSGQRNEASAFKKSHPG